MTAITVDAEELRRRGQFQMDQDEAKRYLAFRKKHEHKKLKGSRGGFSVTFTETGIGTVVLVRCGTCGKDKDVTSYDAW